MQGRQLFGDLQLNWWRGRQRGVNLASPAVQGCQCLTSLQVLASQLLREQSMLPSLVVCVVPPMSSHARLAGVATHSGIRVGDAVHGYPGSASCLTPVPSPARDHDLSAPPFPSSLLSRRDDGAWLYTVVLRIPPSGRPVGARTMFVWLPANARSLASAVLAFPLNLVCYRWLFYLCSMTDVDCGEASTLMSITMNKLRGQASSSGSYYFWT
jgi:hypothetical protein